MRTRRNKASGPAGQHRRWRGRGPGDDASWLDADLARIAPEPPHRQPSPLPGTPPGQPASAQPGQRPPARTAQAPTAAWTAPDGEGEAAPVARRTPTGWRVGDEEVPDLTSAMVLADLLAAELPTESMPVVRPVPAEGQRSRRPRQPQRPPDPQRLQQTVAQLEYALTARVRVEQAIGVLAERHRLRPRQAFELLRSAARSRGRRVLEIAADVVDSASNPLLRIPEELAKPPAPRRRGRMPGPTLG